MSTSGYRAWKRGGRSNRKRLTDAQLLAVIQMIHQELKDPYGSRARFPSRQGTRRASDARERYPPRHKRRYKAATDSRHALPVAPNVLERNPAHRTKRVRPISESLLYACPLYCAAAMLDQYV